MTRLFQIVRPALKRSYQIIPDGEEPLYKVKNLPYPMSNKPDLALLDGPDETAPVLVVCHMPKLSRHFKVGFGDPAGPEPIVWEDFIRPSMGSRERKISVSFSGDGHIVETGKGEREEFTWKRTRHASVPGKKLHTASLRNRKLVDSQGNILAIFTHVTAIGVAGWLQIQVDRGRDFDLMVMMTALSIHEWIRRRQ